MVNFNTVQKVILLGIIVGSVPVLALNMIMPRLAIADSTKLSLTFTDLTVENFTSINGHSNTTTLDLWLQVGLPVKQKTMTASTPDAPTGVTATSGNLNVTLAWTAPASNGGSPITGYKVYVGTASGAETLNATLGVVTTCMVKNLQNGIAYYFVVAATNLVGAGVNSNEVMSTPGSVVITQGTTGVTVTNKITWDTSYYNINGYPNTSNLVDPTLNVFVPQISMVAKYHGATVGEGGSVKVYQLNATHPVEYAHLYLNCSRDDDGGFMYMFNNMAATGDLDNLLLSLLGYGASNTDPAAALLGGLDLTITAFAGSAPLTLKLGSSFFGGSFPVIPSSEVVSGAISPASGTNYPFIHYDHTMNINDWGGTMKRFTSQLGFSGGDILSVLVSAFGFTGTMTTDEILGVVLNALAMIFTHDMIFTNMYNFTMQTAEPWWVEANHDIWTGLAHSATDMYGLLATDLAAFNASFVIPAGQYTKADLDGNMTAAIGGVTSVYNSWLAKFVNNQSSWYWRLFKNSTVLTVKIPQTLMNTLGVIGNPSGIACNVLNKKMGMITVAGVPSFTNLFEFFHYNNETIADLFHALNRSVPQVLTTLFFSNATETNHIGSLTANYGLEQVSDPSKCDNSKFGGVVVTGPTSINPALGSIDSQSLLLVIVMAAFIIVFVLLTILKGTVKINRREFLGREDVQRNINSFIKQVEQLGGKVSVQNAESLVIRAFRLQGKIEKSPDVERRAKTYVENQKLLVTLQSRASRAYVAQKFKDCIAAIEKMIDIARKLEDQTLVANYEDNLAKVVKLLRRKGISVSTKVRVEEGAQAGSDVEKLSVYKKDLIDLQNKASKLFAERNWPEAKNCIKEMLAIAKKIQDPVLIRNYEANLRKIISMEKGGTE